jgi:hypothetical protein
VVEGAHAVVEGAHAVVEGSEQEGLECEHPIRQDAGEDAQTTNGGAHAAKE